MVWWLPPTEEDGCTALAVELLDDKARTLAALVSPAGELAVTYVAVERVDGMDEGLRPRRAAGGVHVHGHDLVDALDDRVVVEHAAAGRANAHRQHPLRLHHLVVDLTEHRGHLLRVVPCDDHEVGLARRGPEDLHADPG